MADQSLVGVVDLHVHSSPDTRPRYGDDLTVAREAAEVGMAAVLIKSHWTLTADRAAIAESVVKGIRVFGGLALNSSVGWLNPAAVETALAMGAAQIWMPTLDLAGPGRPRLPGSMILDEHGHILSVVVEILDLIREGDAILGTGHLAPSDTVRLVQEARERGVQKILREQGPRYVMDYQGLGDQQGPGDTMTPETSEEAAEIVRRPIPQGLGSAEDDLAAIIDELETCRQILVNADRQN